MSNPEAVVRQGSSLHYCLLWTDPAAKTRFVQRLALINAMATTLDDVQEHQVAEKKIHWWHEEIQRLHDGIARHPATRQSQVDLQGLDGAQLACLEIVSVASTQRFTAADTHATAEAELIRSFKARLSLLAHALSESVSDLDSDTHLHGVALAFGLYDQLARLPALIHRGLPVFSDELYQQFQIRPQTLAEHIRVAESAQSDNQPDIASVTPAQKATISPTLKSIPIVTDKSASEKSGSENRGRQQLLAHAINHCHDALTSAMNDAQCVQRYRSDAMLPLWRLLVLRKYQLDLWQKQQPDLLRERTTLTPLVKLYRAWQHRK
ncbi:hypothetical protein OAM69_00415 [bacterium]|nr:hypothetical protein [bacterium]